MTTVIATIGPACASVETLSEMIEAGMRVARMNFSHGDYAFHARMAGMVRAAAEATGKPVALLADLQGAKVRLGWIEREISIHEGQQVILIGMEIDARERPDQLEDDAVMLPVDFDLAPHIKPDATVLIDDGLLELHVEAVSGGHVHCRVVHGGVVKPRKGVNVPYTLLPIPALTDKDRADAAFAVTLNVDWIALSFAGSAEDVTELRYICRAAAHGRPIPRIMAKIERPDGVENLDDIVAAADGVMVARGDLALETSPWQLPLLQKRIVRTCRQAGKPVAVATQMLESMITNHRPTRAEVSDVANALLDGADAVMLSAETAVGDYPVQAVRTMTVISQGVLPSMAAQPRPLSLLSEPSNPSGQLASLQVRTQERQKFVL
ncbi:MAG: pyruvate kinase [Caldilineaceae bacterium]|nr:pyruvate kinase [Caldilineaceae bacterium]MCB9136888.1 pyruvate kinase [Caldilineaceae bacterium]